MWCRTSNCSSLLIYRPLEDERLSWPGWLTYSGRLTHIKVVTRQLQVERKAAKERWPETGTVEAPSGELNRSLNLTGS